MNNNKTHWKNEFNYDYLGSYSLNPGQEMVLTIKETKQEQVVGGDGKKQECFVAYFVEPQKPMILNKTNCKTIAKIYNTPYIEEWVGKKIQVFASKVRAFGEETEALRIRPNAPKDNSSLIAKINAALSKQEIIALHEQNKQDWTAEVKSAAQKRIQEIEK